MSQNDDSSVLDHLESKVKKIISNFVFEAMLSTLGPIATLTEVFFRRNMGERYFSVMNVIIGSGVVMLAAMPFLTIGGAWRMILSILFGTLWIVSQIYYLREHNLAVIHRYRAGIRWHSGNPGVARYPGLHPVVEVIGPFFVGAVLLGLGLPGPAFLMIASRCISGFLYGQAASRSYNRILDIIDSQIEQEYFTKAVQERLTPEESDGLPVYVPAYVSDKFRQQFADAIRPKE